jgi:chaperonin GroES
MQGGIILLEQSKTKPRKGVVVAAGPSAEGYRQGMTVTYNRFAGTELPMDGNDYVVINPIDVLAIN